ncbi:MAG TPA: dihydrolipoamide acetyltransferase family protein [Anaerolineae bacterium]|nr:dihydrolipoamide acetyltransferase family protein [Anaerolineae bacterium]HMR63721.1 dihydrolipoamide acetyltransferase family protein [Anaerolineae bacterium]
MAERTDPMVDFRKATPVAQKVAADLGVDLETVKGTGDHGKITKADVLRLGSNGDTPASKSEDLPEPKPDTWRAPTPQAESPRTEAAQPAAEPVTPEEKKPSAVEAAPQPEIPAAPASDVLETIKLKGIRKTIARRMAESTQTTARVTLMTEVDATDFVTVRTQLKDQYAEEWGFAPGYNDLLAMIVASGLREFPYMNARFSKDSEVIERLKPVHLGMAVDTDRGLLVPVINNADQKGLQQIGAEFRDLVQKTREGKAAPEDLTGSTFTLTSLGTYRVDAFTPVINLPEAAILGIGRIKEKPVVKDGQIVARRMLTLSLVFDHRLTDGAPAARFLDYICDIIEDPALMFITRR